MTFGNLLTEKKRGGMMKKKLFGLFLLCLLLAMGAVSFEARAEENENTDATEEPVAGVRIDETNFPDEAFRTILLEKYDEGNDGILTYYT